MAGGGAAQKETALPAQLLAWYDVAGRDLPWRAIGEGGSPDPYRVWLSEIMLQQTTVATVIPYYQAFLGRWPDVHSLATSDLDGVLHGWQGLGYYARARNLHRCARMVSQEHGGVFPDNEAGLLELPGIGPYTAAAIAAIAFNRLSVVVDGNVERVMARFYGEEAPLPQAKSLLHAYAAALTAQVTDRPGDYAQALMDLGATVCTPRNPDCGACPWSGNCRALADDRTAELPRRSRRKKRRLRYGAVFWLLRPDGSVLLQRRPEKGLLGGMMEFPGTDWRDEAWSRDQALAVAPLGNDWRVLSEPIRHIFTHFELEMTVFVACAEKNPGKAIAQAGSSRIWVLPGKLGEHALPTLMRKVADLALAAEEAGPPTEPDISKGDYPLDASPI
ncbi:MAG: A/G-specific adenine glycosylase [Rhodospirillaceae bacterium]|nr:A/G-specific adenine glycosylase [Rhodospirillaceae bacterium]MBT5660189.1 A/G-specific adenine glycosylase [Rhodospirillaceae bacterium]MBT5752298.1 A/G-specific adenine glycosylase [Rhodospirillaceae bacterium]